MIIRTDPQTDLEAQTGQGTAHSHQSQESEGTEMSHTALLIQFLRTSEVKS